METCSKKQVLDILSYHNSGRSESFAGFIMIHHILCQFSDEFEYNAFMHKISNSFTLYAPKLSIQYVEMLHFWRGFRERMRKYKYGEDFTKI